MARRSSLTELPGPYGPGVRYWGCRLEGPGTARQALRQESGLPAGGHRDPQAVPRVRAVSDLAEAVAWYATKPCVVSCEPLGDSWVERHDPHRDGLVKVHPDGGERIGL
jgi:hypothetical protein